MGISGVDNTFLNSLTSGESIKQKVEQDNFENILKTAVEGEDDEALEEACEQFESYFINKIFSEMREAIPKSGLFEEDQGQKIYKDMLYEAYSKEISKGEGMGLKTMLYKQLKK